MVSQEQELVSKSSSSVDKVDAIVDVEKGHHILEEAHVLPEFDDPNIDEGEAVVGVLEDDSPYPEVRSAVANTDDPSIPVATIRSWVLGMIWAILIAGLNQFFFFRYPSVNISSIVAQLLSFPVGRAWARFMPNVKIFGHSLNPGPFSIKEHVFVTICATVGAQSAYATDIIAVQRVYYHQVENFSYQWLLVISTQLIGFSIGGIARRFLVQPASMIWPANLVTCALFNTLHAQEYAGMGTRGGISRERFFFYCFTGGFFWYFFPGYIFQALSYFSWVTWIVPENVPVNQMFGYVHGMGMSLITFDWAQITYTGSPLVTPWWAEANVAFGFVLFYWILTPALYYTNVWYSTYMPISSRTSYDNTGAAYNVTAIINDDSSLNLAAYEAYSPLFLSTTFAMSYGLSFASITATLMHTILYFRKQIWTQSRRSIGEQPDIHARLMSKYRQVPEWWYAIILVITFVMGIVSIEVWHTQFPVWAFVIALLISFAYVIPIGMIQAITNQQIGLNVITELIIGYMLPGRPIAMMLFKTYGYITMLQAIQFTSDYKLAHYMKIVCCIIIYAGTGLIPPASAVNYVPWAIIGFIFQYVIRRRHFSWWTKYNYVLSAAMDSGVAVSAVVIFFCLQYPLNGMIGAKNILVWWGNTVPFTNADALGTPFRELAANSTFGPTSW
ncbi:hypothetical protein HWV62_34575 [Athelia sp. TMB]|nr:hypothetical protein HWV62_34575 [Athelia sp. TMB]